MINYALFKKEWKEHFLKFAFCIILLIVSAFILSILPKDNYALIRFVTPDETLNSFWYYWTSLIIRWLGLIMAVVLGMASFASEKGSGTAIFLFSRPLTKNTIYNSKVMAGISILVACLLIPTLLLAAAFATQGVDNSFWISIIPAMAGIILIYLMAVNYSIISDEPTKAGILSIITLIMLALPGWFSFTKFLSLLYQMQGPSVFAEEGLSWGALFIFFVVIVLLYRLGLCLLQQAEF